MLGKFLPSLLNLVRNRKREVSPPSNESNVIPDNLITPESIPAKVLTGYFYFSVIVFSVFLFLFLINLVFSTFLDKEKTVQEGLLNEIKVLRVREAKIISVDKKINFYKGSQSWKKPISERTALVLDRVEPGLVVISADVRRTDFNISLVGNNIYLFTKLIMAYLEDGSVNEITINSAIYKPQKQEFTVELKGTFK